MIVLKNGIVLRYCLDRAFFINIHNNKIVSLKKDTVIFVMNEIAKGLNEENPLFDNQEFNKMIKRMVQDEFFEVLKNEF